MNQSPPTTFLYRSDLVSNGIKIVIQMCVRVVIDPNFNVI